MIQLDLNGFGNGLKLDGSIESAAKTACKVYVLLNTCTGAG